MFSRPLDTDAPVAFNRTSMELKPFLLPRCCKRCSTFNRTSMELKLHQSAPARIQSLLLIEQYGIETSLTVAVFMTSIVLLIEPVWN